MKTSIELNHMRFFAYHGVDEQEQRVGNDYEVSLRIDFPLEQAMESDNLSNTLDYAALYSLVASEMGIPSRLLEGVAGRILQAITLRFPEITGGRLSISKLAPPIVGEIGDATVTVEW
ncbi:MAG: dihydroneopterin aldolase [Porphyromonadaceae bacterium]|nr:dihydroneopterin aldolase [Porphyromonadaceae bacterium]